MNWNNTKMILAGPGTGKTTKVVNDFLSGRTDFSKVLVLSFTNATINDLLKSFVDKNIPISRSNCMNLYQYALKVNFSTGNKLVLNVVEEKNLESFSKKLKMDLAELHRQLDCLTFKEMITSCINFIRSNPVLAKSIIGEIDLLIVDEYQDFNQDERELINQISQLSKETLILGDDDQSIYGFKNADPQGIIDLFNDPSVTKLPHDNICYRCPQDVVSAGTNLIKNNGIRVDKEWKICTTKIVKGINPLQFNDFTQTNQYIVDTVGTLLTTATDSSIMVLSPAKHLLIDLSQKLTESGIEFVDWLKPKTDESKQNMIWTLKSVYGKNKLINLLFLLSENIKRSKKLMAILDTGLRTGESRDSIIQKLFQSGAADQTLINEINNPPTPEQFLLTHPEFSEFEEILLTDGDLENNIEKLGREEKVEEFKKGVVNIMTIHKSKGLQADHVFILGLIEGVLPNESNGTDSIEAQRRELFVAISRAKESLYLISTVEIDPVLAHKFDYSKFKYDYRSKKCYGQTSLFVSELKLNN